MNWAVRVPCNRANVRVIRTRDDLGTLWLAWYIQRGDESRAADLNRDYPTRAACGWTSSARRKIGSEKSML
jgi:hypothetical protein